MMDGLGLAETTPGPLILVLQFAGFVGAWQHPGNLNPILAASVGSALTSWVTLVVLRSTSGLAAAFDNPTSA